MKERLSYHTVIAAELRILGLSGPESDDWVRQILTALAFRGYRIIHRDEIERLQARDERLVQLLRECEPCLTDPYSSTHRRLRERIRAEIAGTLEGIGR